MTTISIPTLARLAGTAILLAAVALLSACGGGDPDEPDVPPPNVCDAQPRPPQCL